MPTFSLRPVDVDDLVGLRRPSASSPPSERAAGVKLGVITPLAAERVP